MVAIQSVAPSATQNAQVVQGSSGGGRHHQRLAQVAQSLGVDPQKLQDAVKRARQSAKSPEEFIQAVASQIGQDPAKVKDAFDQVFQGARGPGGARPTGGRRDPDGDGDNDGGGVAKVASSLGVDPKALIDAMKQVESKQSQDFISQLAAQLGKDPKDVQAALQQSQGAQGQTSGVFVDAQA